MIRINTDKARTIAHFDRRAARAAEFAPLDAVIARQIPGEEAQAAEAARKAIRGRDADFQRQIDTAPDAETLTAIVQQFSG